MRLLLDSHVARWWLDGNTAIGATCRSLIEHADEAYVSVVTPWELGIKRALGKLTMPAGLVDALEAGGFRSLAISADHAELSPTLPPHHRDPFDRILVAQARLEALSLVIADQLLGRYEIHLVDARH